MIKSQRKTIRLGPWRATFELTARTILPVIGLLLVAGMYLTVNARLARSGRQLLDLQDERAELERLDSDLTATLAELTTPERMYARALDLGFRPAEAQEIEYIVVPGYRAPADFVAPLPPSSSATYERALSPAYTETLGAWLTRALRGQGGE